MVEPQEDKGIRLAWDGGTFGNGYTIVSRQDVEYACTLSLWLDANGYVRCSGAHPYVYLHNALLRHSDPRFHIDHINNIKNDNRRSNLRVVPRAYNTSRPWRVDDDEEARFLKDYSEGRLTTEQVHEWFRKRRNGRGL